MKLVQNPERTDVLLMENLYGDVVSDLAAGLVGGLGVVPGSNIGDDAAVFEAVHGSAPDIAGKGVANPCGAILSLGMLLEYVGQGKAARRVEDGVRAALAEGTTPDAGGRLTTESFTAAVVANLK